MNKQKKTLLLDWLAYEIPNDLWFDVSIVCTPFFLVKYQLNILNLDKNNLTRLTWFRFWIKNKLFMFTLYSSKG